MKWKFLDSGVNSGKFNMDFDVFLAENFEKNTAILRLYRWNPYCISLGANQSFDEIDLNKTQHHQIDLVKRPTGGRAILHSQELTYSVIYPIEMQTSAKKREEVTMVTAYMMVSHLRRQRYRLNGALHDFFHFSYHRLDQFIFLPDPSDVPMNPAVAAEFSPEIEERNPACFYQNRTAILVELRVSHKPEGLPCGGCRSENSGCLISLLQRHKVEEGLLPHYFFSTITQHVAQYRA